MFPCSCSALTWHTKGAVCLTLCGGFSQLSAILWMFKNLLGFLVPPSYYISPVHLCLTVMLSWFSSPYHNFWASLKAVKKKKLAGGCKFALYLRHPGILNSQGSSSSAFSNSLKLHHVLFSASMMVSSSFLWSIRRKQLVSITAGRNITYWILVS